MTLMFTGTQSWMFHWVKQMVVEVGRLDIKIADFSIVMPNLNKENTRYCTLALVTLVLQL